MSFKTPRVLATGMGAARSGTHHWWQMRVSSFALIPLTILAVPPFARALGGEHANVVATYQDPFNAIVAILFVAVMFHHLMQGLQVVIEDYVHDKLWRTALLLGNTMMCAAFGFAGVFAILKLAFS